MTVGRAVRTVVVAATLLAGCESPGPSPAPRRNDAPVPDAKPQVLPPGAVGHVVVFWLKEPGSADGRRRVIEASDTFRAVPGVLAVEAGEVIPSPRRNVDRTYDVAVVMWFRDRDALDRYQTHPAHLEMLAQVGPLIDRTIVYDFTSAATARPQERR